MKPKHILLLLVITHSFVSCTEKATPFDPQFENDQPLSVSVGVNEQTKTPVIGKWLDNLSEINIILLDKGSTSSYNVAMKYSLERPNENDGGTWKPANEVGLIINNDVALVRAHHPASDMVTLSSDKLSITPLSPDNQDLGELNVSTTYQMFHTALDPANPTQTTEIFSAKNDVDYLTGVGNEVNLSSGATTLITMKHARAMIVLRLTAQDNFSGSTDLRMITFQNRTAGSKPLKKGSFNISDNRFTATANEATYIRTMRNFPLGVYYSTLVNPATLGKDDVQAVLIVGDMRYTLNLPATTWESGKVYIYNIRLVGYEIQLLGVSAIDWPVAIERNVDLN